jgi:hypothetical protein
MAMKPLRLAVATNVLLDLAVGLNGVNNNVTFQDFK